MPHTAKLFDFAAERERRKPETQDALLATMATLECPKCDCATRPHFVSAKWETHYTCQGVPVARHRPLTWRIDEFGDMLHGARGTRYYR